MQTVATSVPLPPPFADAVRALLGDALAIIDQDQDGARRFIARARSLVESDEAPATAGPARGTLAPWQARRVERQIEDRLGETLRVEELAVSVRLSASYFSRAFKATFGQSFSQYVIRRRIERARAMLLATDEPIAHIALACGLADQSHFTRLFHRLVGTPPHAWRRRHAAGLAETA
ncbi:MAG: helix-turn-helix transcriptional regulator [Alphaproteobacteria bacterium]